MSKEKYFVISDIHGCMHKLERLIETVRPELESRTLVFLGDYIDRGPDSCDVVEFVLELRQEHEVVFLKGNHEKMLLDFLAGINQFLYLENGGELTLASYYNKYRLREGEIIIPSDHLNFFYNLELYYETEDYIFVHAGLRDDVPLNAQTEEDLLWIREEFIYSTYDFGKTVIFGHTPFLHPFVGFRKIGIDTGAVFGNTLTMLSLPEMEFVSV
ncbi:MAG: serine/threonine protein phosphatase [Deltaproteobacteria bacterium]|nr:MAG: serine/threonine protein phosphatase [Deltaproteobacteria bacterium]RLB09195.1 MAG: serine/threonine protein phosphatase [Deltaproteobacteria bacterium]